MDFEQAKERAVKFTALSKKTDFEVRRKLKSLSVEEGIIDQVSEYLKYLGYIDDVDYVESFIRQSERMEKLSIFEIKQKLFEKGVDKELVLSKLQVLEDTDYEKRVVTKLLNGKLASYEEDKKRAYLYRKGFKINEWNCKWSGAR